MHLDLFVAVLLASTLWGTCLFVFAAHRMLGGNHRPQVGTMAVGNPGPAAFDSDDAIEVNR